MRRAPLRLPPTPSGPTVVTFPVSAMGVDPFVTFPGAPYAVANPERYETDVLVAGGYRTRSDCAPNEQFDIRLPTFSDSVFDVVWYDVVESQNGRKAMCRIVMDVSNVSNIDVSGGFGSVYFSFNGPHDLADVHVACVDIGVGHVWGRDKIVYVMGDIYAAHD